MSIGHSLAATEKELEVAVLERDLGGVLRVGESLCCGRGCGASLDHHWPFCVLKQVRGALVHIHTAIGRLRLK